MLSHILGELSDNKRLRIAQLDPTVVRCRLVRGSAYGCYSCIATAAFQMGPTGMLSMGIRRVKLNASILELYKALSAAEGQEERLLLAGKCQNI